MTGYLFRIACIALLFFSTSVQAADNVILSLDTGGHMSLIRSIAFTPDGRRLISASDDKTIRIWDLETGKSVATLRGEVGDGDPGKVLSIAVSPDGRLLAAGGRLKTEGLNDFPIRLYDIESGQIVGLFRGHQDAILSLSFSPDGSTLASGAADDVAVVWNVESRQPLARLEGHKGDVNIVRFNADGSRLYTGSDDRTVGIWDAASGGRLATLEGHQDLVLSLAVSASDGTLASGGFDRTIRLWNGDTGESLGTLEGGMSNIMGLSFSPDGRKLLTGAGNDPFECQVWDMEARKIGLTYRGHDNVVFATAISPDGRLAATAGGSVNEIQVWELDTGKLVHRFAGLGRPVTAVGISLDGGRIAWGHEAIAGEPNSLTALSHVLRLPEGDRETGAPRAIGDDADSFLRAVPAMGDLTLSHQSVGQFGYYDQVDVTRAGKVIGSALRGERDGYAHTAYGLLPTGQGFIAGGGVGNLTLFGLDGTRIGDFFGHTGDVWALSVSNDGTRLLSGADDQTLRWWNVATRELIASLFQAENGEWVLWTPQGYFSASPEGDSYVGWQINQGFDKAARFITAAQLKRHFYRPDILRRALLLGSSSQAVGEASGTGFSIDELLKRQPPVFTIVSPVNGTRVDAGTAEIGLALSEGETTGGEVTVNGRKVKANLSPSNRPGATHVLRVPVTEGDNRVVVTVSNQVGSTSREVSFVGGAEGGLGARGRLFVVAAGVDAYPNLGNQNLDFAGIDARAFYRMLIERAGPLHTSVTGVLLANKDGDRDPTAGNLRAALKLFEQAKPEDTVVLFLAGHGVNDGPDYLFLPTDARRASNAWVKESVIDWRFLQQVVEGAQGKRIMLVDTCHAGNAFNPRLVKDAVDASIAIFAATDAETLAQERPDLKHGVFTYAVLQGLRGAADKRPDRQIQEDELSGYVNGLVSELTGGKQKPDIILSKPGDFVLTRY
ncbi:MAG: hypothetical protein AB7S41_07370 [Parvibaculaceae bacterium]